MSEPNYRDETWLREHYIDRKKTVQMIADECDCAIGTISNWLRKNGIETRNPGSTKSDGQPKKLHDKQWLWTRFVLDNDSTNTIADDLNVSKHSVVHWLRNHEIENFSHADKGGGTKLEDREWLMHKYVDEGKNLKEIASECSTSDAAVRSWLTKHGIEIKNRGEHLTDGNVKKLRDAEWLENKYIEKEQTSGEIACSLSVSASAVREWLRRHGIKTRPRGGLREQNNEAVYGKGWNESKKQTVRSLAGHQCQDPNCTMTQREHLEKCGQKLHVHHLLKARKIEDPEKRNSVDNLVALCAGCHRRWEKISEAGIKPQLPEQDGLVG